MANPIPCGICHEVDDAEFVVTDRTPDAQIMGQFTMGVCVRCFIEKGFAMANALQEALAQESAQEPVGTGALERIEQEEGSAPIAPPPAPTKRTKRAAPESNGAPVSEEAEAADVDG